MLKFVVILKRHFYNNFAKHPNSECVTKLSKRSLLNQSVLQGLQNVSIASNTENISLNRIPLFLFSFNTKIFSSRPVYTCAPDVFYLHRLLSF